ncbi:hypothetical protein PPEP_b0663 [Pseudoalteromonas peptidolytica F12-50-A1]|uniref:Uncharacterized protein n=1 Tax=Pseudoalteromonas peptidolytica F12-50-A1 TaxID=1315280 RepID=A0A8I0N0U0_9GAMM|nr:hypothetical protein [Pseudoalteromonas peptidolytica F12-50-A1]
MQCCLFFDHKITKAQAINLWSTFVKRAANTLSELVLWLSRKYISLIG